MAIQIIKPLEYSINYNSVNYTSKFIAGYNSNIIKWTSDTAPPIITGQKSKVEISINDMTLISVGDQFTLNCNGTIVTFNVVLVPTNENEIRPYSFYGTVTTYAYYLKSVLDTHSVVSAIFTTYGWYWSISPPGLLRMRFESIVNDDAYLIATLISGSFVFTNTTIQEGAEDVQTEMYAEIWINNFKFVNLKSVDNIFEFDIKEVVKSIFGKFDDNTYYNISNFIKVDDNLFKKLDIKLIIKFTDETEETNEEVDINTFVTRAVRQHSDIFKTSMFFYEPNRIFNAGSGVLRTLALIRTGKSKTNSSEERQYLKVFKGFPFDVSIIADPTNTNSILTLFDMSGNFLNYQINPVVTPADKYLQRVIISDGQSLHGVFTPLPLFKKGLMGINSGSDTTTKDSSYLFELELVNECGIYLKWINGCGGWSYWLFNSQHEITHTSKSIGTVLQNAGQLDYQSDEINIGVDAEKKLKLTAQNLENWYLEQLLDIGTSPCIYIYNKPKGTLCYNIADAWLKIVEVNNFKYVEDSFTRKHKVSFDLQLPKIFTQTL